MKRDHEVLCARTAKLALAAGAWAVLFLVALPVAAEEEKTEPAERAAAGGHEMVKPLPPVEAWIAQTRVVPLEPLPLPEEPAPEPSLEIAVIEERIRDWAAAWSRQRIGDYLSFYSSDFRPTDGSTRQEWARSRNHRLSAPAFIEVELESLKVRMVDGDQAWVEFVQTYRSNSYEDVVTKMLELGREKDVWKIVAETVISTGPATAGETRLASAASPI